MALELRCCDTSSLQCISTKTLPLILQSKHCKTGTFRSTHLNCHRVVRICNICESATVSCFGVAAKRTIRCGGGRCGWESAGFGVGCKVSSSATKFSRIPGARERAHRLLGLHASRITSVTTVALRSFSIEQTSIPTIDSYLPPVLSTKPRVARTCSSAFIDRHSIIIVHLVASSSRTRSLSITSCIIVTGNDNWSS